MALALIGVMVFPLSACKGGSSQESSSGGSSSGGDASLSVTIWDSYQEPGITEIINDFTEKTGIDVDVQVVAWEDYWTMLSAGAQGGSLPDVFWMHSNEAERYMSNDMLLESDRQDRRQRSDRYVKISGRYCRALYI